MSEATEEQVMGLRAPDILEHPSVRTIIERGMLWATRTASAS